MRIVGVVAEYNPFHLGHVYHLNQTRQAFGGEVALVCAMSGNFVQRGECALLDKWSRTACALKGGADLVLELPTAWATASAERFAQGAVELFSATGLVDALSFGCETGDTARLRTVAEGLRTEEYRMALKRALGKGLSFAAAREQAVRTVVGEAAQCLVEPNNNLAVEYLKAMQALGVDWDVVAIPRRGAGHDGVEAVGGLASASAIRSLFCQKDWRNAERYLPTESWQICKAALAEGYAPANLLYAQRAVLARLRGMDNAEFCTLPDSGREEGLPQRLVHAARAARSLEEFCARAKTKRYAHARIRRLALWAFLGLTDKDRPQTPLYLRVLGMNERGRAVLGRMKETATRPILTKPAHAKKLDRPGREAFEREAGYTSLYALCTPNPQSAALEWINGPVLLSGKELMPPLAHHFCNPP